MQGSGPPLTCVLCSEWFGFRYGTLVKTLGDLLQVQQVMGDPGRQKIPGVKNSEFWMVVLH